MDSNMLVSCITYGLTQVIALKCISSKKYVCKIYFIILALAFLWRYAAGYYYFGEYIFGFLLSLLIIPSLIIAVPLMISINKFTISVFTIGFICQITYVLADIIALAISRMIINDGPYFRVIYCILTPIISFCISHTINYLHRIVKRTVTKKDKYVLIFVSVIVIGILLFISYFLLLQRYSLKERWLFVIVLSIMVLFIFICLMFMIIYAKYVKESQQVISRKNEMERLMTYAATMEKTYINMVKLKHDYKNLMIATKHDSDSSIKLNTMISDAFSNYDTDEITEGLTKISIIPFKSFLATKMIDFISKNVHVSFLVHGSSIEYLYIDFFDAIRILGILLDNAFEEAIETEEKYICIAAMQKKDKIIFVIENSCRENILVNWDFIKKGISTKSKDRGIGLSNFKEILGKYQFCSYCIRYKETKTFSVELILTNLDLHG